MKSSFLKMRSTRRCGQDRFAARSSPSPICTPLPRSREAMFASTATLSDADNLGKTSNHRRLYDYVLPSTEECDKVVFRALRNHGRSQTLLYLCPFSTSDKVPRTLGHFCTSGFYARNFCATNLVKAFASLKPASFFWLTFSCGGRRPQQSLRHLRGF